LGVLNHLSNFDFEEGVVLAVYMVKQPVLVNS